MGGKRREGTREDRAGARTGGVEDSRESWTLEPDLRSSLSSGGYSWHGLQLLPTSVSLNLLSHTVGAVTGRPHCIVCTVHHPCAHTPLPAHLGLLQEGQAGEQRRAGRHTNQYRGSERRGSGWRWGKEGKGKVGHLDSILNQGQHISSNFPGNIHAKKSSSTMYLRFIPADTHSPESFVFPDIEYSRRTCLH